MKSKRSRLRTNALAINKPASRLDLLRKINPVDAKRTNTLQFVLCNNLMVLWYREGMAAKAKAPKETATLDHYFPRYLPRRFNITYLAKVGIDDSRKTWHSFRHTFKTGLAMAGLAKDMRDELCGHADNSAGAGYVHEGSVEAMKAAIEKLTFDGFALA
jgi:integrase